MKNEVKHFRWRVRTQQEGNHFCVYYQHHYPHRTVENRDPRRFNSLAVSNGQPMAAFKRCRRLQKQSGPNNP